MSLGLPWLFSSTHCADGFFLVIPKSASFVVTALPSNRLQTILKAMKIEAVCAIEYVTTENQIAVYQKTSASVKKTLNTFCGVYICVNMVNGHIYVGSAILGRIYRRFSGHLLNGKGGSEILKRAIAKHGLENFAFVVAKLVPENEIKDKTSLIALEQHYIDTSRQAGRVIYNIALKAYSNQGIK